MDERTQVIKEARKLAPGSFADALEGPGRFEHVADRELAAALEVLISSGFSEGFAFDANDACWDRIGRWLVTSSENGFCIVSEYANADEASAALDKFEEEAATYTVVRMYQNENGENDVVAAGLSLEQAQALCRDPETSSSTCKEPENVRRTEVSGPWFCGYERSNP